MGLAFVILGLVAATIISAILVALFGYWPKSIDAAAAAGVWTEVYAIGSLFQLVGLAAAAVFARRAWKEAEAARGDVAWIEEIANRAYLTTRAFKAELDGNDVVFHFNLHNGGRTPAHDVVVMYGTGLGPEKEINNHPTPEKKPETILLLQGLDVGYEIRHKLSDAELHTFKMGKENAPVFAATQSTYRQVFSDQHRYLRCAMKAWFESEGKPLSIDACGIDYAD